MLEPLTTTAAILTIMAHSGTIGGRTKLLAGKIKNKLKSYILNDTLETLEAVQQDPKLLEVKQEELTNDLDSALQENPALAQELKQLIDKEAAKDVSIGQVINGNVSNTANDQGTIISGNTSGNIDITHNHNAQNPGSNDNNVMKGGQNNYGDIDVQLNNSSVGGNINKR